MKTLLLGSDFMYNSDGDLVPIEINTNVGIDKMIYEDKDEIFDFTQFSEFVASKGFTKVTYVGAMRHLSNKLKELYKDDNNITFEYIRITNNSNTSPDIEDSDDHLIIRSSYDSNAIVDDLYCKDKINFLELIKNEPFGKNNFAYINEGGDLVNNITEIKDNGNHPNFILKYITPHYDKTKYPKLYKVSNQSELDIILQNLDQEKYITDFHYNDKNLVGKHIRVIRTFNLLIPPDLDNIPLGSHSKLPTRYIDELSVFDEETFEISESDKNKYITGNNYFKEAKLLDTDLVELYDGTFKTGLELEVGDNVKTINVPNPDNISLDDDKGVYNITYDEFVSGCTYDISVVTVKTRVDKLAEFVNIEFVDGTDWQDTTNSSYLVLRDNNVMFRYLYNIHNSDNKEFFLQPGDFVILIDTTDNSKVNTVLKQVKKIKLTKQVFSGWEISIAEEHLFLTKTDNSEDNISYAAIEHNVACGGSYPICDGTCGKASTCSEYEGTMPTGCACY